MYTFLGIDYPTLWFLVVGALFSGYAILDGFDLGAGALHLFFKEDKSRRIALNAVGPVWDGNEVWLVIGGGALFAGFPVLYASLFSALYIPFMLFLMFIIMRAVSIEFRSKEKMKWWTNLWDILYSISSSMLAFLLGVVLGNVLQGIPLNEYHEFTGSWLYFLNPYSISVGFLSLFIMMLHGAIYLTLKTEGLLFEKIVKIQKVLVGVFIFFFIIVTTFSVLNFPHHLKKFTDNPFLFVLPVLAILSIANIPRLLHKKKYKAAFLFSSVTFAFLLMMVAAQLYPTLLIASNDPALNITIFNAASSGTSLGIMLTITAIGAPLVIIYTVIVYRTFWGKVKLDDTSY